MAGCGWRLLEGQLLLTHLCMPENACATSSTVMSRRCWTLRFRSGSDSCLLSPASQRRRHPSAWCLLLCIRMGLAAGSAAASELAAMALVWLAAAAATQHLEATGRPQPHVRIVPPASQVLGMTEEVVAVGKPSGMPVHVAGQHRKNTVAGRLQACVLSCVQPHHQSSALFFRHPSAPAA